MAQTDVHQPLETLLYEQHGVRITLDRHRPGKHRARVSGHEVSVWALIADLQGNGWDIRQTAENYALPEAAVQVALDYYRSEPQYIDAFLLLNEDVLSSLGSA